MVNKQDSRTQTRILSMRSTQESWAWVESCSPESHHTFLHLESENLLKRSNTFSKLIFFLNFASDPICQKALVLDLAFPYWNCTFSIWCLFSGSSVTIWAWTYLLKLMLQFPNLNLFLNFGFLALLPSYVPAFWRHSHGPITHISQVPPGKFWCWTQGQSPTYSTEFLIRTPQLFIYLSPSHLLPGGLSPGHTHLSSIHFVTYLEVSFQISGFCKDKVCALPL